jgi:HlyD family secretion protein
VMDVFVEEGQKVEQGDPLFTIDSPNAATEVQKARDEVEGYQKQINTLQKDIAGLNLSPSYAGKLMDVVTLNPGDEISKGTKVAVLADDTRNQQKMTALPAASGRCGLLLSKSFCKKGNLFAAESVYYK